MKKVIGFVLTTALSSAALAYDIPVLIEQINVAGNNNIVIHHDRDLQDTICQDPSLSVIRLNRDGFDRRLSNSNAERQVQLMTEAARKNAIVTVLTSAKSDGSFVRLRTAGCTSNGRPVIRGALVHETP